MSESLFKNIGFGVRLCFTEMVVSQELTRGNDKTPHLISDLHDWERTSLEMTRFGWCLPQETKVVEAESVGL